MIYFYEPQKMKGRWYASIVVIDENGKENIVEETEEIKKGTLLSINDFNKVGRNILLIITKRENNVFGYCKSTYSGIVLKTCVPEVCKEGDRIKFDFYNKKI